MKFAGYDHRVATEVPALGTKSRKKRRNRGNSSQKIHFARHSWTLIVCMRLANGSRGIKLSAVFAYRSAPCPAACR